MIRKIVGVLIIITFFAAMIAITAQDLGLKLALIVFVISIVSTLFLVIGVVLIFWDGM